MAGLWKALGYTLLDWCLYPHELVMGFCQILYPPSLFFFLHFQGPKACWAPGNPGHPDSRSSHHLFLATQPGINPSSVTIVLASETNFKHSTGGGPVKLYRNLLAPGIIQHYCQVFWPVTPPAPESSPRQSGQRNPCMLWKNYGGYLLRTEQRGIRVTRGQKDPLMHITDLKRHWPQSTKLAAHCLHVVTLKTA